MALGCPNADRSFQRYLCGGAASAKAGDVGVMEPTQLGAAWARISWFAMTSSDLCDQSALGFPPVAFIGWDQGVLTAAWADPARLATRPPPAAILARVMRSAHCLMSWAKITCATARAKGLDANGKRCGRHGFAHALIPVLTIIGCNFSFSCWRGRSSLNKCSTAGPSNGCVSIYLGAGGSESGFESVVMLLVFSVILVNFLVGSGLMPPLFPVSGRAHEPET